MKRNLRNKALCLLLSVSMLLGMLPAVAATEATKPVSSTNIGSYEYEYDRWATPVDSYLLDNQDGTFTRVEYTGEAVIAELYNSSYEFVSRRTIEMELPIFGGFYEGSDSYFLILGQDNPKENDSCEVVRVIRYTKNWERVGSASLYGANTVKPFEAGSLRCVEYNGYLYIRTAHEMYASGGINHQANLTMNVRISDMVMTDSYSKVMNNRYGYVSHSFNQFITVANGKLVTVDHGDALPRAVIMTRYLTAAGQDLFMKDPAIVTIDGVLRYKYADTVNVLPIGGASGNNDTGVALGGFEASNTHYLIAGNTIDQNKTFDAKGQRNIFISATSVNDFTSNGTTLCYLTNHTSGVTVSNPQMVKINQNRYAVLWMETVSGSSVMKWAFVDGTGKLSGQVYSGGAVLSDCQPIVSGNKLVWYVTGNSVPAFMTIDLNDPTQATHQHVNTYTYVAYPSNLSPGRLSCACAVCGMVGEDVIIPAIQGCDEYVLDSVKTEPTCTTDGYGYYVWTELENYDVMQYTFGGKIPATGHRGETVSVSATCTSAGSVTTTCATCGAVTTETIPALGHKYETVRVPATCTAAGSITNTCTVCGDVKTETVSALGHNYETVTVPATCTAAGSVTNTCTTCGNTSTGTIPALGHHYETVTVPATCTADGSVTDTCTTCGNTSTVTIPALGHHCEIVTVPSTCITPGSITDACTRCEFAEVQVLPLADHDYENGACKTCGQVIPGGVLSGTAVGGEGESMTVALSQNGVTVYSVTVTGGDYLIRDVAPGEYTLTISGEKHVTYSQVITIGTGENSADLAAHLIGDVNGDNRVNVGDVSRIYAYAKKSGALSAYEFLCADVNNDGRVNVGDTSMVYAHAKKTTLLW